MTWRQVVSRRVRRHLLATPAQDMLAAASRLCGVHAQVASSSEQILGVRCPAATPGRVSEALWKQRSLVKTWGMRGALHLFPSDELPTWVAAFRTRQWPNFTPAWERYHGVTPDELRAVTETIGEVLPGRQLTREELTNQVVERLKAPHLAERMKVGWGQMLKPAAAGGLLCSGEPQGRNVTFASPRDWVGSDTGTSRASRRRCARSCSGSSTGTGPPRTGTSPAGEGRVDQVSRAAGWISPVLLVDGKIAGVWSPERAGGAVTVTVTPFGAMPAKTRRGVEQHATRYESLFDAPVRVSWTD